MLKMINFLQSSNVPITLVHNKNIVMTKLILKATYVFVFFFAVILLNFSCAKQQVGETFCDLNRKLVNSADSREGKVGYYSEYNKWVIYEKVQITNNIDSRIIGFTCDIPSSMQVQGLDIIFSGNYFLFNNYENIKPQLGGDELYFLKLSKIEKK